MAVTGNRIIRMTATLDTYNSGQRVLLIAGCRLVAPADSTAVLREGDASGPILMSMAALAKTVDESVLEFPVDSGKLHLTLTGAAAEVFVYLK